MKITLEIYPANGVYNTMLCYQHKLKVLVLLLEGKFDELSSSLAKTITCSAKIDEQKLQKIFPTLGR